MWDGFAANGVETFFKKIFLRRNGVTRRENTIMRTHANKRNQYLSEKI